jgi:hypothetical protein
MRVTRRTRPSQVGCGASIARRRLLHASASDTEPPAELQDPRSLADLPIVIQFDFEHGEDRDHELVAATSSARGLYRLTQRR